LTSRFTIAEGGGSKGRIFADAPVNDPDHQRVRKADGVRLFFLQREPDDFDATTFEARDAIA